MAPASTPSLFLPRLFLAALVSSAAVVLLRPVPAGARRLGSTESVGFSTHMTRVRNFPCSQPQPRAVASSDVLTEGVAPDEHVMPMMTVLHRCDSGTGCCDQAAGLSCGPAEGGEEAVSLVFRIETHFSRNTRFVWAEAVNHTACACRNLNAV